MLIGIVMAPVARPKKGRFGSESGLFWEIPGEPRKIVEMLFRA
jgi:hypothetical protein